MAFQPGLNFGPLKTFMAVQILLETAFQRREQFFALFGWQLLFIVSGDAHTFTSNASANFPISASGFPINQVLKRRHPTERSMLKGERFNIPRLSREPTAAVIPGTTTKGTNTDSHPKANGT